MVADSIASNVIDPDIFFNSQSSFDPSIYFPYEPRPHQIAIIDFIRQEMRSSNHLILEAANGTGKTIAVLAAVLEYVKQKEVAGKNLKVVYLTRTHNQSDRVIEELIEMGQSVEVKAISKRGRQSLCIEKSVMKSPSKYFIKNCENLKKKNRCEPYRRFTTKRKIVNNLIQDILFYPADSSIIKEECLSQTFCPAEMTNALLKEVDIVACSYLYLFEPNIRQSFLNSMNLKLEDLVIIIDECHNLPQVVYDLGNKQFNDKTIISAKREAKKSKPELLPFLHEFGKQLQNRAYTLHTKNKSDMIIENDPFYDIIWNIANETTDAEGKDPLEEIIKMFLRTGSKVRQESINQGKPPYSALSIIGEFLAHHWNVFEQDNIIISLYNSREQASRNKNYKQTKQQYSLLTTYLTPSMLIKPILNKTHASIHMSGSIGTNGFSYKALTGISFLNHKLLLLPSPYDPENIKILVVQDLTTKYKMRSPQMYEKMARIIKTVMENTSKNAGLYVPSYDILTNLKKAGLDSIEKPLFFAEKKMSSEQTDVMINTYKGAHEHGALLTSVMSGRSSEGTDFSGNAMEFVFVIGLPYEPMSTILERRIDYFNKKFEKLKNQPGWEIVYGSKAWQQLSQAAGRPLRSLKDRVCVIIMEERVKSSAKKYSNLHKLPAWMRKAEEVKADPELILAKVKNFYK
ncbi:MAG: ATP-dependent DNA helicase [Candidatus Heimdallarchaeota archaeon LC_2]|nr:MAG: ATP-dependent DNA helicase [Candidatus Heimdallarchaeota archaeon LC_2]